MSQTPEVGRRKNASAHISNRMRLAEDNAGVREHKVKDLNTDYSSSLTDAKTAGVYSTDAFEVVKPTDAESVNLIEDIRRRNEEKRNRAEAEKRARRQAEREVLKQKQKDALALHQKKVQKVQTEINKENELLGKNKPKKASVSSTRSRKMEQRKEATQNKD